MREMKEGESRDQDHRADDRWVETFLNKIAEVNMGWRERLKCV